MPNLSNRIGWNDSPSSSENQQTKSMTEKFLKSLLTEWHPTSAGFTTFVTMDKSSLPPGIKNSLNKETK